MIKPDKKKWARLIFNPYEENLLKRNFGSFFLSGEVPVLNPDHSLIVTPNHFSWWDGFFIDFASRKFFSKNFYIIMLEEQLKRYSFFRKVGAFSIEPSRAKGIKESLDYCAEILFEPQNLLVFYPQGSLEPYGKEPLTVKPGLVQLLKNKKNIDVLPAAFRIEYSKEKKPDVYFMFGRLTSAEATEGKPELLNEIFQDTVNNLNKQVISGSKKRNIFKVG